MLTSTHPAAGDIRWDNSWTAHFRGSVILGVPFVAAQIAQLAINTTDVVMVGRLGATELASIIIATQMFFTIFVFGSGFSNAVVPMVAQAVGRGDVVSTRRSVRMGMWAVLIYGVLTAPFLWMAEPILLFAGQQPEVAEKAAGYLHVAQWAIFPSLVFMVLRAFLSGLERAGIILYITLITLVLNAGLCYLLIYGHFGFPALGMVGAAWAALTVAVLGLVLAIVYIQRHEELRRFELFVRFWNPDWHALKEVVLLGLPIALTILAEVSLFTVASLLMGTIGTVELAAHGIALQFASIAFMIPLGLAQAATVRVGLAYGRGDMEGVRRAGIAALALGTLCAAIGSTLFAVIPYALAALYLDTSRADAAMVLAYAGPLIVIAGAFQLVDGLQAIAAGMLRGLKDTTVPMLLALVSYWPIGFFSAWLFAFPLGLGGQGVWYGFSLGLLAAACLLNARFFRIVRKLK
ncbi:MATE family multidrug resistance protein [Rhizobium sp. PP-F2F-G48]|uniref:MATE family efflux transporter n=1 Tax=Rhizobium sp. PP-F2F-G48 TaxID=2135651 RepID=UPI001049E629|nr:MATE family efflux transporter [Rhizobium sp. PP-F2F-G48]TCM58520.1 MATE family multidrug resistance protein [Rhizobium sp. PP-F2F-G48]